MKLPPDQQRIKTLLTDTITLLCKNGLNYDSEFAVDALIGITVDQNQVFLVNIREKIGKDLTRQSLKAKKRKASPERDNHLQNGDFFLSDGGPPKEKLTRNSDNVRQGPKEQSKSSPEGRSVKTSSGASSQLGNQDRSEVLTLPSFNDDEELSSKGCVITQSSPGTAQSHDSATNNNNYQKSAKASSSSSVTDTNTEQRSSDVQVKREPSIKTEESDYTMQLLYPGQDDKESSNSEIPNLATGPPVWPEPTISFSGLTLPTVIAPDTPDHSPVNPDSISGQSQVVSWGERRHSKSSIVVDNYKYYRDKVSTKINTVYWKWADKKCRGRLIDRGQNRMLPRGIHNHPPMLCACSPQKSASSQQPCQCHSSSKNKPRNSGYDGATLSVDGTTTNSCHQSLNSTNSVGQYTREKPNTDAPYSSSLVPNPKNSGDQIVVQTETSEQVHMDKIEMHKSYSSEIEEEDVMMLDSHTAWVDPESPPGTEDEPEEDNIILL